MSKYKKIPFIDITKEDPSKHTRMDHTFVAPAHEWTYYNRNMDFNKDLGLKGKFCYHPFNTITVDSEGDVYLCICQAWLPISIGKIWDFHSFESLMSSPRALEIQASIIDGSYRYCDHNSCSIIKEGELKGRIDHKFATVNWINFAIDNSCNLTCPSCRINFNFINEGPEFEKRIRIVDHLKYLIEQHYNLLKFTLSGDGDPFASLIYRHFLSTLKLDLNKSENYNNESLNYLHDIQRWFSVDLFKHPFGYHIMQPMGIGPFQNLEIELVTNGLLLKDHWHKIENIHKSIIRTKISFDAGSETVYNITRRGGNWYKLLESSKFITKWKQKNYSDMVLTANFVVQTSNYKDMPAYVSLCDQIGFDEINFQKITDWGTFANFKEHAIWQEDHPEHLEFLKVLEHPSLNNKKINFTNLK